MKHLLFLILLLSSGVAAAQDFSARLVSIRYFEEGNGEFPIKVSICFEVKDASPRSLFFVAKYSDNVTYTAPIKECDSTHVYYNFNTELNQNTTINLLLENKHGHRSATYTINALPTEQNVIKKSQPW